MTTKRVRVSIEEPFEDLLGKPALLRSEDSRDYAKLHAAFEREIDPKSIFDRIRVQDLTDKFWEEQRLKRSQAALIDSALVQALAMLFAPHYGENLAGALETAQNYYSGVPEKVRRAEKLLVQLGIGSEQIEANAMHIRSLGLQMLDRMITNRETVRNSIIKEHERRKRKAEKAKRRTAINDNAPAREAAGGKAAGL
jgi:hypothetical protein